MKHLARALFLALMFAVPAGAQAPDASGTWSVRLNAPDGPHDATLTLTKAGGALSGAIKGPEGEYKIEGTQKGTDVSVSFIYTGNGSTPITLKGVQSGDAISGAATFGDQQGDWSGKRTSSGPASGNGAGAAGASAVDVSGAWAFEVMSPAGSGTPTITFNQSGEKLSGTYVGQLGEAPIQGTLRGADISFSIDVSVQDVKLHIVYMGTVTKDGMKGTASFGDLGEGTFTARRK